MGTAPQAAGTGLWTTLQSHGLLYARGSYVTGKRKRQVCVTLGFLPLGNERAQAELCPSSKEGRHAGSVRAHKEGVGPCSHGSCLNAGVFSLRPKPVVTPVSFCPAGGFYARVRALT